VATRVQHKPAYRDLALLLRQWREAAGLTQRELAAKLGVVRSFVDRSESGTRRIDPVEFKRWCLACGVDPAKAIKQVPC
jgi:transcriptional regulator with XRE-family HTH domain